ncbi:uncharacterized protein LOC111368112 [Olea europaea var. sylvestris]|uniref:uncharacterized protein LOC111368112 n=1 Tax=Olea europaea var. sylvestris TaxID=158386 RepID=UPI000C1D6D8F|nr:uncharacterized protein LOC111368112 [Olea europaea var. sylvestris]XP_022845097.1 uncharacterized protein LOC111368112 [Olea europaea var. sylvestris]
MEESRACDGVIGNNQGKEGISESVTISNELKDMSVLEGNLEVVRENEAVDQGDEKLQLQKSDSPSNIEVSDRGINLFVQLLCSQDGINEGRNNVKSSGEHVVRVNDLDQDKQEHKFGVGDMVWVKTPNQLWWPGMIRDPSTAAKDPENFGGTGYFLVKYFGNVNSLWCPSSNLKPFLEYFEQMLMQSKSSIFLGSVEKALSEIGWRVKAEMTCPCFLKESQKLDAQCLAENQEVKPMSKHNKMGKSNVLSLSQFKPSSFLACVRHLGRVSSLPGKIEFTIIKNRLSAFYSSVGHCQLPLLQLRPPPIGDTSPNDKDSWTSLLTYKDRNNTSEGNRNCVQIGNDDSTLSKSGNRDHSDDTEAVLDGKSMLTGKGHESRERKKSRYLSYPYVDVNRGLNTVVENGTESPKQIAPSCDQNAQKKVSKKPFKGPHKVSKSDNAEASSAKLLAELRTTALDSFYLKKGKHFNSLKRFYCNFRQFIFLDHEKFQNCPEADIFPRKAKKKNGVKSAGVKATDDSLGTSANNNTNNSSMIGGQETGSDVQTKGKTTKTKKAGATPELPQVDSISFQTSTADITNNSTLIGSQGTGSDVPTNGETLKTKKAGATPELPQVDNISFQTRTNHITNNSCPIGDQETGSQVLRKEKTSKKRKTAGATLELPQFNMIDGLLSLYGNDMSFSVEKVPFSGTSTSKGKLVPKRKKDGLAVPNKNAVDFADANIFSFTTPPGFIDMQITVQSNSQLNNGAGVKHYAKYTNAKSTARESEVNMNKSGLGSSVQTSFPGGLSQSDSQPEDQKRKRKSNTDPVASPIPDLNGDVSEPGSQGKDMAGVNVVSPDGGKPEPKRRRRYKSSASGSNVNTNKMSKKEDLGAILFLNFAPGSPPPSKETFIPIFSRFGLLKESETRVVDNSMAQIAYERKSDGVFACRSLEKSNPLGASLASYNIIFPGSSQTKEEQNSMQTPRPFVPAKALKTPEAPNLVAMRKNVEMMKSYLEKEGNALSPETRTKLENEIKGFLNKISTMVGSSSS